MRDQDVVSVDVGPVSEEDSGEPPGSIARGLATPEKQDSRRFFRAYSEIGKLYLFHFFLSISLTAVASFLFLDRLLLRMGLSMSQFGVIKGLAFLVPVTLNLILAPYLARLGRDREIVVMRRKSTSTSLLPSSSAAPGCSAAPCWEASYWTGSPGACIRISPMDTMRSTSPTAPWPTWWWDTSSPRSGNGGGGSLRERWPYRSTGLFARGCVASLYWLALMKVVLFLGLIAKELIT